MTKTAVRSLVRSFKKPFQRETPASGYVDDPCSRDHCVIGWASKRSDGRPEIDILVNGDLKLSASVVIDRPDLIAAGLSGTRGFNVWIAPYLVPGENEIEIRFSGTAKTLPNGKNTIALKPTFNPETYEDLYETNARHNQDDSIGGGDYYIVGRTEFELLVMEGLGPADTVIDFGCGNGRLAVHVIPYLEKGGTYIGIDIAETYLEHAAARVKRETPKPACSIRWVHQTTPEFPIAEKSVNMICAFSVFTHMEHEDTYNYLKSALKITKPGGKFIYSCLPLHLADSKGFFYEEAKLSLDGRWQKVRNVVTSVDLMTEISQMAGWKVLRWYEGNQHNIGLPGSEMRRLGQSSCVLEAP